MKEEMLDTPDVFEYNVNIYRLAEEMKIQARNVIDFSSSVNPLGVSKKIKAEMRKHLKYLHNYPDPEAKRLKTRLALYHNIDPETVLCGNGSTELIYLVTKVLNPQRVLIPAPTYSEYEQAVQTADSKEQEAKIEYFNLKKENDFEIKPDDFIHALEGGGNSSLLTLQAVQSFSMAFLCNPNNPTGKLIKRDDIKKIADFAKELRCYLIVDEAFIDFCPGESVIKDAEDNPYLIVMRTMSHFHALSGLRIGYGVFPRELIERLKKCKEPWTINSLAQRAAVVALKDNIYRHETLKIIKTEKIFLEKSFRKMRLEFIPSAANFYLAKTDNVSEKCRQLRGKGILVRDCSHLRGLDSTYMRIAVKSHKENSTLIKELMALTRKKEL